MPTSTAFTQEQLERLWETIEKGVDVETAILKGHLWIEYWLGANVLDHFPGGDVLLKRFPYYSQKLDILEAAGRLPFPKLCARLRALNSLRNDISHALFPVGLDKKIIAISVQDLYGFGSGLDLMDYRQRLLVIVKTSIVQLGNWSDTKKHEWAKDAMS